MIRRLETDYIDFEIDNGILLATYKPAVLTVEVAKEVVMRRKEFCSSKSFPHLVMDYGVAKIDKQARDFFSSDIGTEGVAAAAILTDSSFKMALANFFLKVSKPKIPARLFTSKTEAIEWLQQFRQQ